MQPLPQCFRCKHLRDNESEMTCDAYPNGIPKELINDEHNHTKHYAGDNGILFEAKYPSESLNIDDYEISTALKIASPRKHG